MAKLILNPRFLDDRIEPTIENATAVIDCEVCAFMLESDEGKPGYFAFTEPKSVIESVIEPGSVKIVSAYPVPPIFERLHPKVEGGHLFDARFSFKNANFVFMRVSMYDKTAFKEARDLVRKCQFIYDDRKGEFVKEEITMDELRAKYGLRCILPKDLVR